MKILVFMSDNRPVSPLKTKNDYWSLAAVINYEYCKKYNYDFLYYVPYLEGEPAGSLNASINVNTKEKLHAAWSKLLSARLAAELEYDYIVYIDTDCIFKDFSKSLEKFIEPHTDKLMIFLNSRPWCHIQPCSGFFATRVCDESRRLIKDWYEYDFKGEKNPCRWEQGALWKFYKKINIATIDAMMFREEEGQYLRHINFDYVNTRVNYFTDFIAKNNIPFDENVKNIRQIRYDTTPLCLPKEKIESVGAEQ